MIRPLTVATFLMACGSGLYLYQSKHEVQVLDRTIERTVHDTGALREQSRLLAAEWTMLTNPERLRQFSDTYLHLKTIAPSQFTSLADLNNRLPPARVEPPHDSEEDAVPVVVGTERPSGAEPPASANSGTVNGAPADGGPVSGEPARGTQDALPVPPVPAPRPAPVIALTAHSTETRLASARPSGADIQAHPAATVDAHPPAPRPTEPRQAETRQAETRAAVRNVEAHGAVREASAAPPRPVVLATPRPAPTNMPAFASAPAPAHPAMVTQAEPFNGSLLGMARAALPSAPRPTPVNASYNN